MNEFLKKLISNYEAEVNELRSKIEKSENVAEVRELGQKAREVESQLAEARAKLQEIEAQNVLAEEARMNVTDTKVQFNPIATYGAKTVDARAKEVAEDGVDSVEYRSAFMNLVLKNEPIPAELRDNQNTTTSDVASVIPTVLVNRIIERFTICGMILPLVTRTSFAAGVVIPTSSVKPVASWVGEGEGSERQKKTTGKVTFSYFKLRCEISMSMEVGVMALSAFEAAFVANVADAMVVAVEKAILAGDGSDRPTGILHGGAIDNDHVVKLKTKDKWTYADIIAAEAAVPVEYENVAKWFMTKAQFMKIVGMTDNNGQPIARVDYGIDGKLTRNILGREVVLHPYATEMGDHLAGIFDFRDYVLNTIYDMGIQKKQSWETEDLLTKAVMSVDGKPVDKHSLILIDNPA